MDQYLRRSMTLLWEGVGCYVGTIMCFKMTCFYALKHRSQTDVTLTYNVVLSQHPPATPNLSSAKVPWLVDMLGIHFKRYELFFFFFPGQFGRADTHGSWHKCKYSSLGRPFGTSRRMLKWIVGEQLIGALGLVCWFR